MEWKTWFVRDSFLDNETFLKPLLFFLGGKDFGYLTSIACFSIIIIVLFKWLKYSLMLPLRRSSLENLYTEQIVGSTDQQPLLETPGEVSSSFLQALCSFWIRSQFRINSKRATYGILLWISSIQSSKILMGNISQEAFSGFCKLDYSNFGS